MSSPSRPPPISYNRTSTRPKTPSRLRIMSLSQTDQLLPANIQEHALISHHPDKSTGIVSDWSMSSGSLIFEIEKPLLAVVAGNEATSRSVCDGCFAVVAPEEGAFSIPEKRREHWECCGGCGVVWYCSFRCQEKAWERYHEHECAAYVRLKDDEDYSIHSYKVRSTIRVLALYARGLLPEGFMEDMEQRWRSTTTSNAVDDEVREQARGLADTVKEVMDSEMETEMIEMMIFGVKHSSLPLEIPLIRGRTNTISTLNSTSIGIGSYSDPSIFILSHSCAPNAWVVFEGSTLRVRALRDIKAGEELTITYTPGIIDPSSRMQALQEDFELWCKCALCLYPLPAPTLELQRQLMTILTLDPAMYSLNIPIIESTIQDLLSADLPEGTLVLHALHEILMEAYVFDQNYLSAFKTCLRIYHVIEPSILSLGRETLHLLSRVGTLYRICSFFDILDRSKVMMDIIPIPPHIVGLDPVFKLQLRLEVARGKIACLGADSTVGVAEMEEWKALVRDYNDVAGARGGRKFQDVSAKSEREVYDTTWGKLLKWAGLVDVEEDNGGMNGDDVF